MKVLIYRVGKEPSVEDIEMTLEGQQAVVEGLIEYVYPFDDYDLALVCNEEGKINGLQPNKVVCDDVICGNFFVTRVTPKGENADITEKDIEMAKQTIEDYDERDYYPCFNFITF